MLKPVGSDRDEEFNVEYVRSVELSPYSSHYIHLVGPLLRGHRTILRPRSDLSRLPAVLFSFTEVCRVFYFNVIIDILGLVSRFRSPAELLFWVELCKYKYIFCM